MDTENLSTAMGLSKFERRQGVRLIERHVDEIKQSLVEISKHSAIKNGLVAPRVVENLISLKNTVGGFNINSARKAEREFMKISDETYELSVYFPVEGGAVGEAIAKTTSSENTLKFGSTPWNGEIRYWRVSKDSRDIDEANADWVETIEEFENLRKSLREFHIELGEVVNSPPEEFKRFDHVFLDGGAFRFALNNFNNLEGVRERKFVNQVMQTRLEKLANKLDPNVSGSLSHSIRLRQASSTSMTKLEVKKFYDDFDELWKPFLDDREWFDPDELSSYYRLAKPRLTMMSRSTSANE